MRKMIRWSLLLGVIFCLMGVGMITSGFMMGGGRHLVQEMFSDEDEEWELEWHHDGDSVMGQKGVAKWI